MDVLDTTLSQVRREVDRVLSTSPLLLRRYTRLFVGSSGKFLRARAVLICAATPEKGIPEDAIPVAAAIELIHLASLVHDDIIDEADKRRGKRTLNDRYDTKIAVLCGDYLIAAALRLMQSVDTKNRHLAETVPDFFERLIVGELDEHRHEGDWKLSEAAYLKIISGKTAALFEAAFYCGSMLSETPEKAKDYMAIGHDLGMIFQITDDCLDYAASTKQSGKPVRLDFSRGVITLPLIYTFMKDPELRTMAAQGQLSARKARAAVRRLGGIEQALKRAKKYQNHAQQLLVTVAADKQKQTRIMDLFERSLVRV